MYPLSKDNLKIDIVSKLPTELKQVYMYGLQKLKLDMSSLIYIYLYGSLSGKIDSSLYSLDYNNLAKGIYIEGGTIHEDIGIAVYVNRLLYETIAAAIKEDKNYFNSNRLGSMKLKIGNIHF